MKLSKQLRYLVRVRDYETVQVEVAAEADYRDLGIADPDAAHMRPEERIKYTDLLHDLVNKEVDKLAREELVRINQWSEISPNLAEDFLASVPSATLPIATVPTTRSHNARNPKASEAPKRNLRRTRTPSPTPPAA